MKITNNRAILAGIALVITGTILALYLRPPVLVVVDEPFTSLYGVERAEKARISASFSLKRPVRSVLVADSVSTDVLTLTVTQASRRPYCVVFPYRYAEGARRYYDQHPRRRVLVLAGRASPTNVRPPENQSDDAKSGKSGRFYVYTSGGALDFYRAGRIAGIFGNAQAGEIPVFFERRGRTAEQDAFSRGLRAESCESSFRFLDSFAQLGSPAEISTIVLAGSGMDYLDKTPHGPLIVFTWLDPAFTSREMQVVFDDSPWAQLITAVKLARRGKDEEAIPSKILIFSDKIADKGIVRSLEKAARSSPGKEGEQP